MKKDNYHRLMHDQEYARARGKRASEGFWVTESTSQLVDALLDHRESAPWYEGAIEARLEMDK